MNFETVLEVAVAVSLVIWVVLGLAVVLGRIFLSAQDRRLSTLRTQLHTPECAGDVRPSDEGLLRRLSRSALDHALVSASEQLVVDALVAHAVERCGVAALLVDARTP